MKNKIILLLILSLLFIATFIIGCKHGEMRSGAIPPQDTLIIHSVDTVYHDTIIKDTVLQPKYIKVLKRDTVFTSNGDTLELVREAKTYNKRLTINQDTADLKICVSGIETSLDSLKMRLKTHETIKTVEVIKLVEKPRKLFEFKPQITGGYDPLRKEWGVLVGFGCSINL